MFQRMLELLNEGGVGAVHFTYARTNFQVDVDGSNYAPGNKESSRGGRYHFAGIKRAIQSRLARTFQRRTASSVANPAVSNSSLPTMQMNAYLLNPLFQVLQQAGVREMHMAFTDHAGTLGTVLFFKKGPGTYLLPALCE
jgi:hypothetical protein